MKLSLNVCTNPEATQVVEKSSIHLFFIISYMGGTVEQECVMGIAEMNKYSTALSRNDIRVPQP
jgi:hypothetical protein